VYVSLNFSSVLVQTAVFQVVFLSADYSKQSSCNTRCWRCFQLKPDRSGPRL